MLITLGKTKHSSGFRWTCLLGLLTSHKCCVVVAAVVSRCYRVALVTTGSRPTDIHAITPSNTTEHQGSCNGGGSFSWYCLPSMVPLTRQCCGHAMAPKPHTVSWPTSRCEWTPCMVHRAAAPVAEGATPLSTRPVVQCCSWFAAPAGTLL